MNECVVSPSDTVRDVINRMVSLAITQSVIKIQKKKKFNFRLCFSFFFSKICRYGIDDPSQFGLRQRGEGDTIIKQLINNDQPFFKYLMSTIEGDRWLDDKVVVQQSPAITKTRVCIERRKGN